MGIGQQDNSPSNGHQGDIPYFVHHNLSLLLHQYIMSVHDDVFNILTCPGHYEMPQYGMTQGLQWFCMTITLSCCHYDQDLGAISLYRCRLTAVRNHFVEIRSMAWCKTAVSPLIKCLVHDCSISRFLAMEVLWSCTLSHTWVWYPGFWGPGVKYPILTTVVPGFSGDLIGCTIRSKWGPFGDLYLARKILFCVWNKLFLGEINFPKGELVL